MPNPYRGEIPPDPNAGHPAGAARLRAAAPRIAALALQEALARDPSLRDRCDDAKLRLFLRDYEAHLERVARSLASGSDYWVQEYGEWISAVMRRRRVPTSDLVTLVAAIGPAAKGVLSPAEQEALDGILERWVGRQSRNRKLAGDRKRNPILAFFWRGVGIAD